MCTTQAGIQNAATASAAIGLVNVVGTIIAGSMIEKAGRVQLLTVSFTGMCISMFAMVAGRSLPQLASSAGTIAFAGTVAYVLSFALGAGPVPGLLVPEINTEQMRGAMQTLGFPKLGPACQLAPGVRSCPCFVCLHNPPPCTIFLFLHLLDQLGAALLLPAPPLIGLIWVSTLALAGLSTA